MVFDGLVVPFEGKEGRREEAGSGKTRMRWWWRWWWRW